MQMFAREVMDSGVMNANQYLQKRTGLKNIKRANMVQQLTFVVNVAKPLPGEPHTTDTEEAVAPQYHPFMRIKRPTKPFWS